MIRQQHGFSLMGVLVSAVILSACFIIVVQILLNTQNMGNRQQRFMVFNDLRAEIMNSMGSQCAVANTVLDSQNKDLGCLYEGNCAPRDLQPLTLRDDHNNVIYSPTESKNRLLTANGSPCQSESAACKHKLDLAYKVECEDGPACQKPYIIVEGQFAGVEPARAQGSGQNGQVQEPTSSDSDLMNYSLYRIEKRLTYRRPYLNCQDVVTRGLAQAPPIQMASGMYLVDPDGPGKICPFEVYCDLAPTSDGGGWTLVANQGLVGENMTEVLPPLYKGMTGRLPGEHMKALLDSSVSQATNNVRVKVESRKDKNHILAFHVGKDPVAGEYTTKQTFCQEVGTNPIHTSLSAGGKGFSFIAKGSTSQIGFKEKFFCTSCDPTQANQVCTEMANAGCCSDEIPVTGSLWIK